jgi:hypothetical protein
VGNGKMNQGHPHARALITPLSLSCKKTNTFFVENERKATSLFFLKSDGFKKS